MTWGFPSSYNSSKAATCERWIAFLNLVLTQPNLRSSDVKYRVNILSDNVVTGLTSDNEAPVLGHSKVTSLSSNVAPDTGLSITQILHLICNGNDEGSSASKRDALQQLVETFVSNDHSIWTKGTRPEKAPMSSHEVLR